MRILKRSAGLSERFRSVVSSSFVRSVGLLAGSTAVAQVILGATLPIATRLYSPHDFSLLAVFTAMTSLLSVSICLRYDIAVALPEKAEDGAALVVLSVGLTLFFSALIALPVLAAPAWSAALIGQPAMVSVLWLLPVACLLAGAYSALQFWNVRDKAFSILAKNRIAQATFSSMCQIGLGLARGGPIGLILGQTISMGGGAFLLGYRFISKGDAARGASWPRICEMARQYKRFPAFSTIEAFSNSAGLYFPIILLGAFAEKSEAGFVALAMYGLQLPMSLLGNAVSQVYVSQGPAELRAGRLPAFTIKVLSGLMKTGVGPLICLAIVASPLFKLVFGPDWTRAGYLVMWMTPWFVFQFLGSPLSLALHISNRLALAMGLQIFGAVLRTASVMLAYYLPEQPFSVSYALSGMVFYICFLAVILRSLRVSLKSVFQAAARALPICAGWIILGFFGLEILKLIGM